MAVPKEEAKTPNAPLPETSHHPCPQTDVAVVLFALGILLGL